MTTPLPYSSWIASMAYKRTPDGATYLAFFLKPYKNVAGVKQEPTALLYGGPGAELPSWLPGLIAAGKAGEGTGEHASSGAVYHRLVKGKHQGQVVKGEGKVKELKEMMK